MVEYPLDLYGYLAILPAECSKYFTAKSTLYKRKKYHTIEVPFYLEIDKDRIGVGFGTILVLSKANPFIKFKIRNIINDHKFIPLNRSNIPPSLKLFPYQDSIISDLLYCRGGLVSLTTSGGKTELQVAIAAMASVEHNVLFTGPTAVVTQNFIDRCKTYGIHAYSYYETRDKEISPMGNILVVNPIGINNDFKKDTNKDVLKTIGTVINDECHHLQSVTWQSLFVSLPNLVRSIGLSATAISDASRLFVSFNQIDIADALVYSGTGPVIQTVKPKDIEEYIDCPHIINIDYVWPDRCGAKVLLEDNWHKVYDNMMKNSERNLLIHDILKLVEDSGRTSIIPVSRKEVAENILKSVNLPSVCCWFGGGNMFTIDGPIDSSKIFEYFISGKIKHIIATSHVDEGLNIPNISTAILTEGRSNRKQIQRVGRIVRKGKMKSVVINLNDKVQKILESQSSERSRVLANYYNDSDKTMNFTNINDLSMMINYIDNKISPTNILEI